MNHSPYPVECVVGLALYIVCYLKTGDLWSLVKRKEEHCLLELLLLMLKI